MLTNENVLIDEATRQRIIEAVQQEIALILSERTPPSPQQPSPTSHFGQASD